MPNNELHILTQIFEKSGQKKETAKQVAIDLSEKNALGTHMREELGINEPCQANPLQAAIASGTLIHNMSRYELNKNIWTIGHSTRSIDEFIAMLKSFQIECVADIRSFPGSRKYPQFNKEALEISLPQNNIRYFHLKNLGGRRKAHPDSKNTAWRHVAFRGYADYMETDEFVEGTQQLEQIAMQQRTAYMCSEAVWWRCHRSMVSDDI